MSTGLILGLAWLAVALAARGRRMQSAAAWGLAVAGIPVLGLVTYSHGPFWGLVAMAVGILSLRGMRRAAR